MVIWKYIKLEFIMSSLAKPVIGHNMAGYYHVF